MVFGWFKNSGKNLFAKNCFQQRLVILPVLQSGHQIDFIYKAGQSAVTYCVDLKFLLSPGEEIKQVHYDSGDHTLILDDFVVDKNKFIVTVSGGYDHCKSTILFKIDTNLEIQHSFTVLVKTTSIQLKKDDDISEKRLCRLWVLDRNPDQQYRQEGGDIWIEGDMILNQHNHYLWEYRVIDGKPIWMPLFVMNGVIEPMVTSDEDEKSVGERLILNKLHSDQGKIKSNAKGDLTIEGEVRANSLYTKAMVAGYPLGEGMLFTTNGMMAGHSLYIGSPEAKPKHIYIGVQGVVSTKLVSTDYLQLAVLSVRELPTNVKQGAVVLCNDYIGFSGEIVLLFTAKDNPQSPSDWKVLSSPDGMARVPQRPLPQRPNLYPISFNPRIVSNKQSRDNIVDIKPVLVSKHIDNQGEEVETKDVKLEPPDIFTRLQFDRLSIPVSEDQKAIWKRLSIRNQRQQLMGKGQDYWHIENHFWQAPTDGLLHIQGYIIFNEEELKPSDPIDYHSGDILLLNFACNQQDKSEVYPTTQMEFPLVPYINDVTHKVCANQRLSFSTVYPVEEEDKITFDIAYLHQRAPYGKAPKELSVKKIVIELFIS
ncbi:hypothetical protein [Commensalibacter oyaizuii]|uniref:Uncharacterized protein n=1 Tax=Commensalibacter oyaizuii TaxID=3043873 RepID=A0ABT6PY43_9PROT|nr:hypothetical protein [Commensalibacter sp. TBRC 16381]MDI2089783.1 hypothetical protein [Commensalibacter sp. TBRC 16381]